MGVLFVWGDAGPGAAEESAAAPLPINPRLLALKPGEVKASTLQNFTRDFPISHDIMVENTSDQSHVPWAHHGVAHSRASPYATHFVVSHLNEDIEPGHEGFSYRLEWSPSAVKPPTTQVVTFTAPSYLEYISNHDDGTATFLWFYLTPLDDNSTRVITHSVTTKGLGLPPLVQKLLAKRPAWLDHLVLNEVFDGDLPNLIKGAYHSKRGDSNGDQWAKTYYLPATADKAVLVMRKWYQGRGRGGFTAAEGRARAAPPEQLPREQLLDRLRQHTRQCKSCSKALSQLRSAQPILKALAAAALLAAAAALGAGWGLRAAAAPVVAAAAALWLSAKAAAWEALFVFKNYNHALH
ncbi:pheophorbide a oxygenase [Monoraphidium neglectum]|uniref:Pheophorbide a oxygenase n=1 Tax=Monoraphidium neglectum TaxID=145388 RepID=A0A0D2M4Q5_9CHLO|nr:pheophorbide a oxygenase [Monoraphidium neglectum]KIY98519.1 pheophorbide a oxygenase [Monoraphidium neglectum]|eukprot:XP_013897539.1 pheophorbide a oxygenase [Monoraphidium neglectum]